ncbi:GNAT family N-acetyltransferase [Pseudomonas sp. GD03730]|uniref:GNAT family N-acetyltransferase n=1 Tax=Pseudomonas sp. GD03730 TaxID=2975375 RepID=UPI00244927F4|nr:GNAT family N-acetyltransferase [Pseudomonas sp. GD03730]MDH1403712.1 GNAT family N-acetyltransferase [Pseudomonas sp. GD03730]
MHKIVTYTGRVPHAVASQIAQLTQDNVTDLSMLGLPPSNPIYPLYQYTLSTEILQYVGRVGQMDEQAPVRLVVAFADEAQKSVIGFVLYLPVIQDHKACGLSYMAVANGHRRKGIARDMMKAVAEQCPHIELTCFINKVPVYESLGFHVIGYRETQIVMNNRTDPSPGEMAAIWTVPIIESNESRQIQGQLGQKHGMKVMREAERKLHRLVEDLKRKAEQFVSDRAEQIVGYRRPGATVVQVSPDRFELQGVDGIDCHASTEREAWTRAAFLIDQRDEPELRVARQSQLG